MQRRVEDYREQVICAQNAADIPQEIFLRINDCLTKSRFAVDRKVYEARRGRRLRCVVSSFVHSHALIFFSFLSQLHHAFSSVPRLDLVLVHFLSSSDLRRLLACLPALAYAGLQPISTAQVSPVTAPPVQRASLIARHGRRR